jgi:hypothetical protein
MSEKWWAITSICFLVGVFSPLAIKEYSQSQCRIEAIKAGVEADKINTACGVK